MILMRAPAPPGLTTFARPGRDTEIPGDLTKNSTTTFDDLPERRVNLITTKRTSLSSNMDCFAPCKSQDLTAERVNEL